MSLAAWALHGFTGAGDDFAPLREALPELSWHTPDLPGHAPDPRAPGAAGDDCSPAAAIAWLDGQIKGDKSSATERILLGYSLGGRLALRYALARPGQFAALVLVGVSPGIREEAERLTRRRDDDALAEKILSNGVEKFLEEWQRHPLIASQQKLPAPWRAAMQRSRARLRAAGLAASLREFGQGAVEPVWEQLTQLRLPVLVCAGADDAKYSAFAAEIQGAIPDAEIFPVPNAGHMAHLENCDAFAAGLRQFLARHRLLPAR